MMTVGELIKALGAFPPDMVVEAYTYGDIESVPVYDLDVFHGMLLINS